MKVSCDPALLTKNDHFLMLCHEGQLWPRVTDKKWSLSHAVSWRSVVTPSKKDTKMITFRWRSVFMVFHGYRGWFFMVFHGSRLIFYVFSWFFMVPGWLSWFFMVPGWFFYGFSWFFMVFHGFHGFSWFFSKIYPPKLYPGPMIQSRSAAQRAA